ncbi:pyrroloquinoline quinone biosynthesis protein PqqF [Metapseudomonas resinovorans]|uniref:Coenzyme PQQ synthesis protein F n=1 Tax=Metapseudomonas resinovorans NBRC 106553 TaxID=1245471 RepID=S6AS90_METRE|nr:pyrroloquinoline quinone biosynthesis protein PqqF [Pseudomonas resinovorans]BAN48888.1 coenzyme PQQ synthesis protein F [Pseudomonas resinovorans NBRC 106553]
MSSPIALPEPQSPDLQLANGLRLRLLCRPNSNLGAALVEVAGGSHDEPVDFPGLAHFLEHLVFLGSRDFSPEQGLIPFVQRLGGRVNASTRARSTRFFCEVPAPELAAALARLMDMLANPLLETAALWREREVLQAEYSARARDPQTLCEAALAWALAPGHPLADFHAGNAASLALESSALEPALRRFHREHYQPGRMCLTLVAPQSEQALLEMARRFGEAGVAGPRRTQTPPPAMLPLRARRLRLGLPAGAARVQLAFVLDGQGEGLEAAVHLLDSLMADPAPGGLQSRLGYLDLSDGLRLRLNYAHAGQALVVVDCERVAGADGAQLETEVLAWLAFMRRGAPWQDAWDGRLALLQRQFAALEPLELAQAPGLSTPDDLLALLEQLRPERLIRLETGPADGAANLESAGFPLHLAVLKDSPVATSVASWRLPPANRYLDPLPVPAPQASLVPLRPGLADAPQQGALFLHWSPGANGLPLGLADGLQRALRPTLGAAAQAGVAGRIEAQQGSLALELLGPSGALRQVFADLLPILQTPPLRALAQGPRLRQDALLREAGELPIRQLLARLPDSWGGDPQAPAVLDPEALARFWWQSRWHGLGVGDVGLDLELPGLPAASRAPAGQGGRSWRHLPVEGEAALLLFYPLDAISADTEAAMRLLAAWLEPAFHLRLRGELQLGYALACGFRQVGARRGLLFAVQSPRESVAGLLGHLQDFLQIQQRRLMGQAPQQALVRSLDAQLARQGASFATYARQCWFDRQAGLPADYQGQLRQALAGASPEALRQLLGQLIGGASCLALATACAPTPDWQTHA